MTQLRSRSLVMVFLAVACSTVLSLTPMFRSGMRAVLSEVGLIANEGFIMGGTGNPGPDDFYFGSVQHLYLNDGAGYDYHKLLTPEQFCPFVCIDSQPPYSFGDSVNVGLGNLDDKVVPALRAGEVSVFGYSQSATIASVEMDNLLHHPPDGNADLLDRLHVTLIGDPNSPIGGILDRFQFSDGVGAFSLTPEGQHVPFVDIPLNLPTTPTDGIDTVVYLGEYDGLANFPLDPTNIFADINALIGIQTVHGYYPNPEPGVNLDITHLINLGTIDDTTFYAIPAPLPTLAFLYDGGDAGRFFYDAFSPYATLVNNWGYGNPGDPFVGINGTDAIGPWQVDALGHLVESGVIGFFPKMDPLQMLAGMEYAGVHSFVDPINDLLALTGQPDGLPQAFVDSLLSGYTFINQLDTSLLAELSALATTFPSLAPDVLFDGSPLISGQPLLDLVGYGFDIFNFFGA